MIEAAGPLFSVGIAASGLVLLQRLAMFLALPQHARSSFFAIRPKNFWGDALTAVIGMAVCCLFLFLTARPFVASFLTLSLGVMLVVVNRAKEQILREPLVLVDAWLLTQIFRYPHLYFPFLPTRKLLAATCVVIVMLATLLWWETPEYRIYSFPFLAGLLIAFCVPCGVLFLLWRGFFPTLASFFLRRCPVSHQAANDAAVCGPLTAAMMHPVLGGVKLREKPAYLRTALQRPPQSKLPEHFEAFLSSLTDKKNQAGQACCELPHVVLVQAESFADLRQMLPERQKAALQNFFPHWDALTQKKQTLATPKDAFAAYTMRSEFSTLTGLDAQTMGPFIYNPYLLAARQPLWSLARFFEALGYDTLCLHSYAGDFFRRDLVMKNLGFHQFVDHASMADLPHFGPYISDTALAAAILQRLHGAIKPTFCFVVTMEAHGPWLPERLSDATLAAELHDIDRALFSREVQQYLCHVRHMDSMFGLLDAGLQKLARSGQVWAYGDHPPGCIR